ncbi:hypothetical protein VTK73DRAFT_149 [Phialemonium thermophilum]|uniref:Uncharacterized protein n=1 Tax=Phialemonium thermophilum TaxID=223376 RepID=A0ABR3XFR5_9PEZI
MAQSRASQQDGWTHYWYEANAWCQLESLRNWKGRHTLTNTKTSAKGGSVVPSFPSCCIPFHIAVGGKVDRWLRSDD